MKDLPNVIGFTGTFSSLTKTSLKKLGLDPTIIEIPNLSKNDGVNEWINDVVYADDVAWKKGIVACIKRQIASKVVILIHEVPLENATDKIEWLAAEFPKATYHH